MLAVVAAATCWCCALLAIPRLRLRDDPMERRLTARHGRRGRLVCAAVLLTLLALGSAIPGGANPDLVSARGRHRLCTHPPIGFPTCYRWLSTGAWMREEVSDGGAWLDVGIVSLAEPYGGAVPDGDLPLVLPYVEDPGPTIGDRGIAAHSEG